MQIVRNLSIDQVDELVALGQVINDHFEVQVAACGVAGGAHRADGLAPLEAARLDSPLFDARKFATDLENLYLGLVQRRP